MTGAVQWRSLDLAAPGVRVTAAGVRVADGAIALSVLPGGGGATPEPAPADAFAGPAGVGIDRTGNVYVSDPSSDRVLRVDACDGATAALRCLDLARPGGVAVGPHDELYIADTGHDRVVVVDLASGQTIGARPAAEPSDVAVDARGRLLVVERGTNSVQRFSPAGTPDPGFWEVMRAAAPHPLAPEAVAVGRLGTAECVFVLDRRPGSRSRLLVYDAEGGLDRELTAGLREQGIRFPELFEHPPAGIAAGEDRIYVGDPFRRRILVFGGAGAFIGTVPGYRSGVAGLELDARGGIVVNQGAGAIARLGTLATAAAGSLVAGPFALPGDPGVPDRLASVRAAVVQLPDGAQFRLLAWLARDAAHDPPPLPDEGAAADPDGWIGGGPNAPELVFDAGDAPLAWIAVQLEAGSAGSPVLERLRIATGLGAWMERLPAVYSRDEASARFLARMLAVLAAAVDEQEQRIDDLPLLFDAGAVPDEPAAPWLDWLAGWLDFPLGDVAEPARRRDAVAAAFALAARRGTSEGLRETIRLALGVPTWVSEPAERSGVWLLDGTDRLGFDTALTAAEAQGAVLATTATLDRSHLISDADYGAPLFDDLAHHFCVGVLARDVAAPGARAALERLVERERPAHLRAHVCVVEPRARVGFQARIGIDAIVAGDPAAFVLGSAVLGEAATATAATAVRGDVVGATRVGRRGG